MITGGNGEEKEQLRLSWPSLWMAVSGWGVPDWLMGFPAENNLG